MQKIQKTNKTIHMLACFTNSVDKHHSVNNLIHLIGSIFYTTEFYNRLPNMFEYKDVFKKSLASHSLIINFVSILGIESFEIIKHSDHVVELRTGLFYFLNLYLNSDSNIFSNDFLKVLFTQNEINPYLNNLGPSLNKKFNRILYVFENISWLQVQLYFKCRGIHISGGSISNRHLLSTSSHELSIFLALFGYEGSDIFNSQKELNLEVKNRYLNTIDEINLSQE